MTNLFSNRGVRSYLANQYQLLTVRDVQRDEAAIVEVLSAIMNKELSNDLVLLNYYKELPISFGATIVRIERGVADLKVHRIQAAAMLAQNMAFIKSDHLPYCAIANVLKVKKDESLALLTQFSYVHIASEQRTYVRVTVLERVEALFTNDAGEVSGIIGDISYGGVAILAPKDNEGMRENATGTVVLSLAGSRLEIPGTLLRVDDQHPWKKFIIKLEMDPKCEKVVSQFIFKEQIGILRELKDMCG